MTYHRPLEDWADLKYVAGTHISHVMPFGDTRPLCGLLASDSEWYGTGTFDEFERAAASPRCEDCSKHLPPVNEMTAPSPLYAHATPEDN